MSSVALGIGAAAARKFLRKWAASDARDLADWRGKYSMREATAAEKEARGLHRKARLYYFELDRDDPLRIYNRASGIEYRPAWSFFADGGSIPGLAKLLEAVAPLDLDPLDFIKSYLVHDSDYLFGCCWIRKPDLSPDWVEVPLTQVQADIKLFWGLSAESANKATQQTVYRSVRTFGRGAWKKHRRTKKSSVFAASAALCACIVASGCNSFGRVVQGAAGLAVPQYKASIDNVYRLLMDDQLAASLDVEVVLEDKEGRAYRKTDLRPVVLTSRREFEWDALPRGAWSRFLGETEATRTPEASAQIDALSNALKTIPTTKE